MKHRAPSASRCTIPNGTLILIGGAEHRENEQSLGAGPSVLAAFIGCCKKKHPHLEVITTAGQEDVEDSFRTYETVFKELGAQAVGHIHHDGRGDWDEEALQERIKQADGVFMAGGDQLRLTSIYGGTGFLTTLKEAYLHHRLAVAGTSAGAMALSTPMIFGGTGERELIAAGVKVTTGLEFLKDVCVDTHFVHRGRFVRMAQVIATNPASIGIGIEEDTAVIVTEGLHGTVVGNGVVILLDGVRSRASNIVAYNDDKKLTIRDLEVSILAAGETFEIPQRNPPHH